MSHSPEYINQLILGHFSNNLSPEQEGHLKEWINASKKSKSFFNEITDIKNIRRELALYEKGGKDGDDVWKKIRKEIPNLPASFRTIKKVKP